MHAQFDQDAPLMRHKTSVCAQFALYPILLIMLLLFVSCNSSEPIKAEWHDAATDVNGKPDLSELKGLHIKDVQARFVIANDNEQLLLAVQSSDEALRQQIEMGGVTVWLSNPKNKKETVGFRYPVMHGPGGPPKNFVLPAGQTMKDKMIDRMDTRPKEIELLSKKSPSRMVSLDEARALGVSAETNYEATTTAHSIVMMFDSLAQWLKAGDEVMLELNVPKLEMPKHMREAGDHERPPLGMGGDDGFGGIGGAGGMRGGRGGPPGGMPRGDSGGKEIRVTQMVLLATGK